jgi:hypothetical protein
MPVEATAILTGGPSLGDIRTAIAEIAHANVEQVALPAPIEGRYIETVTPTGVDVSASYRVFVDVGSFQVEDFEEDEIFKELQQRAAGKPLITVSAVSGSVGATVVHALAGRFEGFVRDENVSDDWVAAAQK